MMTAEQARKEREKAIVNIDETVRENYLPWIEKQILEPLKLGRLSTEIHFHKCSDPVYPEELARVSIVEQLEELGYEANFNIEDEVTFSGAMYSELYISWEKKEERHEVPKFKVNKSTEQNEDGRRINMSRY